MHSIRKLCFLLLFCPALPSQGAAGQTVSSMVEDQDRTLTADWKQSTRTLFDGEEGWMGFRSGSGFACRNFEPANWLTFD